jgi:hypothetical protein
VKDLIDGECVILTDTDLFHVRGVRQFTKRLGVNGFLTTGVGDIEVLGNLAEPGFDGTASAEMSVFLQSLEERFLSDLFCNVRILAHCQYEQIYVPEKSVIEFFKINLHSFTSRLPVVDFASICLLDA